MAEYDHLPLKRLEGTLERRKYGFGSIPTRDAGSHGAQVAAAITQTLTAYAELPKTGGIDPSLILKIRASGLIEEDEWRKLGMVLLSSNGDNSVVLFANDRSLAEFKRKVEAYQGELPFGQKGPQYAGLIAAIDAVGLLDPVDRIGPVLKLSGYNEPSCFENDTIHLLDVELHIPPDRGDVDIFLHRLEVAIVNGGGKVLSTYAGTDMLLARVEGPSAAVLKALDLPEVSKVDLPPKPDFLNEDLSDIALADINPGAAPPDNAVVIGIIDTGVNFGHPLLEGAEAGALSLDPSGIVADGKGHGTQVASVAAYGDIAARVQRGDFRQQFRIASARVLDEQGRFLKNRSMPDLMNEAIRVLAKNYGCRIFNISLGDEHRPFLGGKVDTWSAALDQLARELDLVIVVSSGNRNDLSATFSDKIIDRYPHYLSEPGSRIIEPATAAIVLTVGAISHTNGINEDDIDYVGVRSICEVDEPSPFTRSGPGIRGMTKPELVDLGGTAVWDGPSNKVVTGSMKAVAGVWAFSHEPIKRLLVSRSGTSLAAPAVANKAAILLTRFPKASANLIRALLGLSASLPAGAFARKDGLTAKQLSGVCGHGVSNVRHAATSDDSRVVLYAEDAIALDHFALFEVEIPAAFQTTKGVREIRVALAFDPPTRHTRADYVGATMGWRLLRGSTSEEVYDRFRKWDKDEGAPPDFENRYVCPTTPGSESREYGTLQVGTYTGKTDISSYGSKYFVAVWSLRRWAPKDIETQRFALAVQLRHENVNNLYLTLRQPIKV